MAGLIVLVLNVVLLILVLGALYALLTWACGLAGIPVPTRAIQIIFAIIVLVALISLFTGYMPPLRFGMR